MSQWLLAHLRNSATPPNDDRANLHRARDRRAVRVRQPRVVAVLHGRNRIVDMKLAVDVIPVSDLEKAKEFYQRLGWSRTGRSHRV
jgi:hypothetical protein